MLIVIGLLFLYVDVWMGGVDFFPDLFGYVFLFIAIFRGWQYQKIYSSGLMVLSIITPGLHVLAGADRSFYWISILLLVLTAVFQFCLLWKIYRTHCNLIGEKGKTDQDRIMQTALILILICEICSPILSLAPVLPYILLGIECLTGIFITTKMWQTIKASKPFYP